MQDALNVRIVSGRPVHDMELETRTCLCGCGRTWKCMPESKRYYGSSECEWGTMSFRQKREALKKSFSPRINGKHISKLTHGFYTSSQAMAYLGVPYERLYRAAKHKEIKTVRPRGYYLFEVKDLERYAKEHGIVARENSGSN